MFEHSVTGAMHIEVAEVLLSACLINCISVTGSCKILEYKCILDIRQQILTVVTDKNSLFDYDAIEHLPFSW